MQDLVAALLLVLVTAAAEPSADDGTGVPRTGSLAPDPANGGFVVKEGASRTLAPEHSS
jgi:hypothetical protein